MSRRGGLRAGLTGAVTTTATLAALLAYAPAEAEELYGLVIGINDYNDEVGDLEGAVNDANLIAAALHEIGARDVTVLRDREATKTAIEATWFRLLATAQAGDTIVFTYAGHGAQEPERPGRKGEEDGKNENFILAGYAPEGPATRERIVDDEINTWLQAADRKGIEVVFVADSCHSGTMFRTAGSAQVRYRTGRFVDPDLSADLLDLPPPAAARIKESEFTSVTFIAATQDGMLTPELVIDGRSHGALSVSFSRAIRGAADRNDDGRLTQQELLSYLVPTVQAEAENQQIPGVFPLRPEQRPIMRAGPPRNGPEPIDPPPVDPPPVDPPPPIRDPSSVGLYVVGATAEVGVAGIEVVASEADADLIWNPGAGTVDHRIGGRVADSVTQSDIAAVLSKWAALSFIKARAAIDPVALSVPSGNRTYRRGDVIEFAMDGAAKPYLTLFNLPPNGRVELFIPANAAETSADWRGRRLAERLQVTRPPFGAEHMVAILTDQPAVALHQALRAMPTAETAGGLSAALRELLAETPFQAGVTSIYTSSGP